MRAMVVTVALLTAFYAGLEGGWWMHKRAVERDSKKQIEEMYAKLAEATRKAQRP